MNWFSKLFAKNKNDTTPLPPTKKINPKISQSENNDLAMKRIELPKKLYLPCVKIPDKGVIDIQIKDASGDMAIIVFSSSDKANEWLDTGGIGMWVEHVGKEAFSIWINDMGGEAVIRSVSCQEYFELLAAEKRNCFLHFEPNNGQLFAPVERRIPAIDPSAPLENNADAWGMQSTLPQRLFVPAIIMPDKGIVYAPVSDAGAMAIPAFESQIAAVNWLESGGDALILPIANQGQLPGGQIGIVDTTPDKLRNGIPSIGGRKRVVHLNPCIGISPDDQTVDL